MDEVVSIPIQGESCRPPLRGVGWVLRWAATFAALAVLAVVVLEFGYCVLAEQALVRAAEAGAREAALPRANRRSVERSIRGNLDADLSGATKIALRPIVAPSQSTTPLSVRLSAPADAALPDWLQLVTVWNSQAKITARVGQ